MNWDPNNDRKQRPRPLEVDRGVPMFMPQTQVMTVLAEPLLHFSQSHRQLARPLTRLNARRGSRGLVPGCWGVRSMGEKLRLNPEEGQGQPGWGGTDSSLSHNLILRLYSLCLGDFQFAIVSFTDGSAVANYKSGARSQTPQRKKKKKP